MEKTWKDDPRSNSSMLQPVPVKVIYNQSRPGHTCDRTCACTQTCKTPSTSEKSPVPTSLSTMQSHMQSRSFVVTTAKLVTVTFCFHNSALSFFIQNERFDILQQQKTLHFGYTNLGLHVQFQIIKSNRSCRQVRTCELTHFH